MIKEVNCNNADFIELCQKLEKEHVEIVAEQRSTNGNCLKNLEQYIHVLLYLENGKAVGSLAISKPIDNVVEIGRVYVLPEYRNKEIATKLFEKAFTIIQNEGNIAVTLNTYNRFKSAVHLYKKLGFKIVDTFPNLKYSPFSICMKKVF
ncbi:MAG: GNAT family N-acetyltransferase [Bacilli bacterium]|nr:GNAT family N-acetyltransferase [Bacilli bacterium]